MTGISAVGDVDASGSEQALIDATTGAGYPSTLKQ